MTKEPMHQLLQQQVTQHLQRDGLASIPPSWRPLLQAVDQTYAQFEAQQRLLQRSLDVTSGQLRHEHQELKYRLDFEQLITGISTQFVKMAPDTVDAGLNQALKALGTFAGVDRSYIFQYANNGTMMDNTHEWCAEGIEAHIHRLKNLPIEAFPYFHQYMVRRDVFHIPRVADLPPEAGAEKAEFELEGIQSLIVVPLVFRGSLFGFVGFDSVRTEKSWDADGIALLKIVGQLFVNVLERRRSEEELRRHAAELTRSNADLEQFAYVASHDLQEPLRMVASYVQLLVKRYKDKMGAEADEFIDYVVNGVVRMQALINDLLTYSRLGTHAKPLRPVDSGQVVDQVIENLQLAVKETSAVVSREALPVVRADASQLGQVFQNLIGNAIKFHGNAPPQVRVWAERKAGEWIFAVADKGIGIDPQYMDRLFAIFQRLHNQEAYPGTGIGLAICKKIVERHGGRIWVESQPGAGATFRFAMPADGLPPRGGRA